MSLKQIPQVAILLVGLPGSGKSTIAGRLADHLDASVITTEVVRARLFDEALVAADRDFTTTELTLTYNAICLLTEHVLNARRSVVIDGVFRSTSQRQAISTIAKAAGVPCVRIHVVCNQSTAIDRLRHRKRNPTPSPGGVDTYTSLKATFEPVDDSFDTVDTSNLPIEAITTAILRLIGAAS